MSSTDTPTDQNIYGVKTKHTLEIKGVGVFTTILYPAGLAFDLLPWLLALAAGPSGIIVELLRSALDADDLLDADVTGKTTREGLLTLSRQIVEHGGASKLRDVLETTTYRSEAGKVAGCKNDFDAVFQGRMMILLKVLGWVLEVQYGPFSLGSQFTSLAPLIEWFAKSQAEQSALRPDSTSPPESG